MNNAPYSKRYVKKLLMMCAFGSSLAELSTCKRAQTACVLFSLHCTNVWSIGYNGPARGLPNDACTEVEGDCGCVHAEANAIAKLYERENYIAYASTMPCQHCASLLVNTGRCAGLIYDVLYRDAKGLQVMQDSRIRFVERQVLSMLLIGKGACALGEFDEAEHTVSEWQSQR